MMLSTWTVDGVEYSTIETGGRVFVRRKDRDLGFFEGEAAFREWLAAVDEIPPVPGAHAPFANDYLCKVAWAACLAFKEREMGSRMCRVYEPGERASITSAFLASLLSRVEFARRWGIPAGTLATWATAARREMRARGDER